ncbi:MAG: bifunctional phosphoglucose/phosphomannose isomerase [Candidatus Kapaibacterium sp.]
MAANDTLFSADKANMYDVLLTFPEQVRHAVSIGEEVPFFTDTPSSNEVHVLGLGGSAIGGDLARSYCAATPGAGSLSITVSRTYDIPGTVHAASSVIASSYSGDTEETLSAFAQARKKTKNLLCITTGGQLAAQAARHSVPVIRIPAGFQPRCALGFSFFPLLMTVMKHPAVSKQARRRTDAAISEVVSTLDRLSGMYAQPGPKNPALRLAKRLHGTVPVIYSASERLDAVNVRWRGQIQENAKNLAFGHVLPEMNQNVINGWAFPANARKDFSIVLLRDPADHARVALRFDAVKRILRKSAKEIHEVVGVGDSLLARMFSTIYLGDWVSYSLAMMNDVDPTPVPVIMTLKSALAAHK